jgi:hypothetical protein
LTGLLLCARKTRFFSRTRHGIELVSEL